MQHVCFGLHQSQQVKDSNAEPMDARSRAQAERLKANNPCHDESVLSLQCLEVNENKESCQKEIANYKKCKQFWFDIYNFRKLHGIRPYQPEAEDRKRIKENYLKNRNFKQTCDEILQASKSQH